MDEADRLGIAAQRYWSIHRGLDDARAEMVARIREAAAAGVRQRDIVKATGWTREQIRRVCRD